MDGDIFRDDDPVQHPRHTGEERVRAAAAVAGDERILEHTDRRGHELAGVNEVADEILAAFKALTDDVHALLAGIHRRLRLRAAVCHDLVQHFRHGVFVEIAHGFCQCIKIYHL